MKQYDSDRHELCGMLRPRGKSRLQSAGCDFLLCQPADQLHGSGRHGNRSGNRKCSCRSRIRRSTQRRKKRTDRSRSRKKH